MPTPFVNRHDELEFLGLALKRARTGQGQVVAVVGEPGVGKSRLLHELMRRSADQGWRILAGEALPGGELRSYAPVAQLLRARLGVGEDEPADQVAAALTAWTDAEGGPMLEARPALQSVLDVPVADGAWPTLDPATRRQRAVEAVADALVHGSLTEPAVILCEGLNWLDPESQACLDALVERLVRSAVLLLVSHRPEYTPPWGSLPYYNPLRLDSLSAEAATELLEALLGKNPRLAPVIPVLVEHTGGHPLFIEECVGALRDRGVLDAPVDAEGAPPLTEIQGLATVQAVLAARLGRLSPEEQDLLELSSVIGIKLPVPILEAVTALPPDTLRARLARLTAAEFLHETGPFPGVELSFRQALKHEVAYASMPAERRRALHGRVLGALEGLGPDHPAARPDVLGEHAFGGEIWDRAVLYLRQAGTRAALRAANGEAVARFRQALSALGRMPEERSSLEQAIDVRLDMRPPLLQLGRLPEVLEASQEAETLAKRIGDEARLARVYTYLANYHYLKGDHETAIGYSARCVAIGRAQGDPALVGLARAYMGYSLHAQGRCAEAERVLAENLDALSALAPGAASPQVAVSRVGSAAWLAFTLADLGEFDRAEAAATTALRIAEEGKNPYGQAIASSMAGLVWLVRGRLDRALPRLEASLAACREKQLVVWQPVPSSLVGIALARGGRADRALAPLADGVARTERLGVRAYLARWTAHQGEGLLAAGRIDAARRAGETALDLARLHHERGNEAEALRLLGSVAARQDPADLEVAADRLQEALVIAESAALRPLAARCHLDLGALPGPESEAPARQRHLVAAVELGRAMDLGLTLDAAVAALRQLGHFFVLMRERAGLLDFLVSRWGGDSGVRVILDRRQGRRARTTPPRGVVILD